MQVKRYWLWLWHQIITKMFARVKNWGARNLWSFIHFIRNHKWNDEITTSLLLQSRKYNWKMHPCQGAWLQDGWDCLPKRIHVVKNKEQSSIKYKATTKSQMEITVILKSCTLFEKWQTSRKKTHSSSSCILFLAICFVFS